MGGWKASGLGSRHGPDGIRKYAKRQSLMITPGYAPAARAAHVPVLGGGHPAGRRRDERARRRARCSRTPSDAPCSFSATPWSRRCPRLPGGRRRRRSPRLLGPRRLAPRRPRGDRGRAPASRRRPRSELAGLGALLDSLAERGMVPGAPLEAREQLIHAFGDSGPEALAGIHTLRGLTLSLFYALPGPRHRPESELGCDRLSGPPAPPPDEPKPLAVRRPEAGAEAMTIEADVCVVGSGAGGGVIAGSPGRGRQAGLRARAGRLLQRGRLQPARGLGLPEPLSARRADPDGRGPGLDAGRARRSAAAR